MQEEISNIQSKIDFSCFWYYKLYITHTLSGFLFDLDQSNVHRDIRYMEPIVSSCIPLPQKLYNITRRLRTVEEVELYFPG